jgi:iron complex transport system substrate-binding protein
MPLNDRTTAIYTAVLVVWMLLADPARAAVEVLDDAGHFVRLARPAERIVSLAPHITELLFAAGAGAALVGVSEYSDYPAAARQLPRVGGGNGLDLEAILALQPDLVIAWGSGNPQGQVARLRRFGLDVFVSEPRVMGDIAGSLDRFGRLTGHAPAAVAAVRRFEARRTGLARRYSGKTPVRVFFQIWDRPLMTVNGDHLISDASRLCGGSNVFADLPGLASQVGVESVLERNPQAIIAVGPQVESAAVQAYWQRWPELAAVRGQHVYMIPRELLVRHTPRILQGTERLCRLLEKVRAAP